MEDELVIFYGFILLILLIILVGIFQFKKRVNFFVYLFKGRFGFKGENSTKEEFNVSIKGGSVHNSGRMKMSGVNMQAGSFENKGEADITDSNLLITESQNKKLKSD